MLHSVVCTWRVTCVYSDSATLFENGFENAIKVENGFENSDSKRGSKRKPKRTQNGLKTSTVIIPTVATLSQHTACPGNKHQHALDHTFRYLSATTSQRIIYQCGLPTSSTLQGFVDVDWASNINDRKSMSSFIFMLAGAAISWSCKKQGVTALSSTEAEYIAAVHAAKEAIWLRHLLTELGLNLDKPTTLHINNQSAIAIAHNPKFHDRTKHIKV
jgi:hypothetical protein